jgi:hypothetical protein
MDVGYEPNGFRPQPSIGLSVYGGLNAVIIDEVLRTFAH